MAVPEDVRLHHVEAAVLGLPEQVRPHLRRAARVVDGAGDEGAALPVDDHGAVVVRHRGIGRGRADGGQRQQGEEERGAAGHGWGGGGAGPAWDDGPGRCLPFSRFLEGQGQ